MLLKKLDKFLPQKKKTVTSDDQLFCSEKMKRLKRMKPREYHKNRKSVKWMELNKNYKKEVAKAKNYETYNRGEGFQLFARKIRKERSKGNHFLVLIKYYLFTI